PHRLREQRGCTCRLPGHAGDQPALSSLAQPSRAASWNAHKDRGVLLCALAVAGAPALAPEHTVMVGHGDRGLPRSRTCASLANPTCAATLLPRTVCGYSSVARPQRTLGTVLCPHPASGDRAARSVWCRHLRSAPQLAMQSECVAKA